MNRDLLTKAIRRWLSRKGVVLWSQWDITTTDGLDKASEWLADQIIDFLEWARSTFPKAERRRMGLKK